MTIFLIDVAHSLKKKKTVKFILWHFSAINGIFDVMLF
jgi:hypothetical protein